MKKYFPVFVFMSLSVMVWSQENKTNNQWKFMSYKGLLLAGYQGWFNAEGDGADRGWNHFTHDKIFEPGHTKVDYWPDVTDYPLKYKTAFKLANGEPAYVFSSYDESTVDLHFKWMKDYGIDGVFMQRFVTTVKSPKGAKHYEKVLGSAVKFAKKYDRTISIMYDLSGMNPEDYKLVIDDWKKLVDQYHFNKKEVYENYLFHHKKPLVAVWGAGFNDGRKYGLKEVEKIVDFLKNDPVYGASVLLGVPTFWRELKFDTQDDPLLHHIIRKIDIVHPWFVGRYNEDTYPQFKERIKKDLAWCNANGLDYAPVAYPGFSWKNMRPNDPFDAIPRNKGSFFWKQLSGAIESGAQMIYVAMFDEIDEGTAIFKCAKDVPVGQSRFVPFEKEIPTDWYMWLAGQAAGMLKLEVPFQATIPYRTY
jgi:hypothetical protein